ncbi:MAG: hypothetical protein HUU01_01180 [Saprospiraceae bacterium]|nr:hypothetical protein [Saprospiraceae bacterium]
MEFLRPLLLSFGNTLKSFQPCLEDEQAFSALLYHYGWDIDLESASFRKIGASFVLIKTLPELIELLEKIEAQDDEEEMPPLEDLVKLLAKTGEITSGLSRLGNSIDPTLPAPLNKKEFWEDLGEQLLTNFLVQALKDHFELAYGFLYLFGVIEYREAGEGTAGRVPYTRTVVEWSRLGEFFQGPAALFKNLYNWDKPGQIFLWEKLLRAVHHVWLANHFLSRYNVPRQSLVETFTTPDYARDQQLRELQIPFISGFSIVEEFFYFIGVSIMAIGRAGKTTPPEGLLLTPRLQGSLASSLMLSPAIHFKAAVAGSLSDVVGMKIFPDGVAVSAHAENIELDAKFGLEGRSSYAPWVIVGSRDSYRLEMYGFDLELILHGSLNDPEVKLIFRTKNPDPEQKGVQLMVPMKEADSFLAKTTQQDKVGGGFDLEIGWSSKTGFLFGGRVGFDLEIPVNKVLGPIELRSLFLYLGEGKLKNDKKCFQLRSGLSLQGDFGPIRFLIEQMGLACNIIPYTRQEIAALPPGAPGPLLGNLGLDLAFAPPRGIGIEVNANVITGGGYLYMNHEKGEYIGVAQLNIKEKINLKAIGIILTKLPDGKKGYSFLLMITAEFQPIQIGLGFSLAGVGGLVGIHRKLDHKKLFTGLRENTMDDILFPANPLDNPYGLVTKINSVFPVAQGQYTFGLLGLFYWGAKDLVTIKLGFIVELPVFRIAIMGVVKAEKSEPVEGGEEGETKSLIRIKANFAGLFDFDKKFIRFDASLYDSHIMGLKLEGDMALRIRYGRNPDFLMTVGGFHPNFQPPELDLPADLRRLSVTLYSGNPNILMECYMAITANTFQFGAAAYLTYEESGVSVRGELSFDALFQFSPFHFEVGLYFLMSASWKGEEFAAIEVTGLLSGPAPWRIYGKLRLEIWKFSIDLELDQTWGDKAEGRLGSVKVMPILIADLKTPGNWEAAPGATHLWISTRSHQLAAADSRLTLHPNELLTVRQNTVPLGLQLDKFSEKKLVGPSRFRIELTGADGKPLDSTTVKNHFAPAQFFERSEEEKISASSYQLFESGAGFEGLDAIQLGAWNSIDILYESKIVDDPALVQPPTVSGGNKETQADFAHGLGNNAVANSFMGSRPGRNRTSVIIDEQFVVVRQDSLRVHESFAPASEAEARQLLKNFLRKNPRERGKLTVLPMSEVTA